MLTPEVESLCCPRVEVIKRSPPPMALAFSDGWLDFEFICLFLLKVISSPEVWKSGNHEQNHNAHEGYLRGTEFAREEKQPQIKKSIVQ